MPSVSKLVREVDDAANRMKELAGRESLSDEEASMAAQEAIKGVAALAQLAARALARRAD